MADPASITEESLKAAITERLQAEHVEVTDIEGKTGGCGQSFTTLIVSPLFAFQTSLKRHRLVNAALRDEIAAIHAWSARCQTPDEWRRALASSSGPTTTSSSSNEAAAAAPPLDGTVGGKVDGVNA
ncbi:bola protein [Xylariaceae sp. FL0594]|nr:bola protein [Xylariaceae sp. FL0594]